ncbi:astacin-like metalloprotease toxin 5 [Folsomia candida]|uniref:astacin-like metalloprotease toxin 5 n=1 Tax=Folsomia candida TaxID=158441 RepID=UPI000B8FDF1E|nr:astacin-like metalloprotease toxin 5 [Folsomia candida]
MFLIAVVISVLLRQKLVTCTGLDSSFDKIGNTSGHRKAGGLEEGIIQVGDMLFYDNDFFNNGTLKGAITTAERLWDGGVIPYEIDEYFERNWPLILEAMQQYEDFTCVKFVARTTEVNYLYIEQGTAGCSTFVGNLRRGKQILRLGRGCLFIGTVVHELGHTVGFHHEHNRIDRDEYIDVLWENIQQGSERLFVKTPASKEWLINGYDIDSIMHYGETAFSKDGVSPTMKSKDGRPIYDPWGKPGLDWSDIYRINKLYNC